VTETETGGRVEIDRLEASASTARYRVTLRVGDAAWQALASLGAAVDLGPFTPPDPPRWLVDDALGFLRTMIAHHVRDGGDWPRRLHRWRVDRSRS
jgi:hypothetical protein